MKRKLILFDIDGTAYDHKNHILRPKTIETIKKLKEAGHELAIATGRGSFMIGKMDSVRKYVDHYIFINGLLVTSHDKVLYQKTVDIKKAQNIIEDMRKEKIAFGVLGQNEYAMDEYLNYVVKAFTAFSLPEPIIDADYYKKYPIYQIWCFGDNDTIDTFAPKHKDFQFVSWGNFGFDVMAWGESKGKGLDILLHHLDMKKEDVIAIGDSDNDVEMIQKAGIGIAMGNGSEALKKVSDYITDDVSEDGFYKAFQHFNLI